MVSVSRGADSAEYRQYFLNEIMTSPVMKSTAADVFGGGEFDMVERPGCFILLLKHETEEEVHRIIVLKPSGFTSNSLEELSSHPEAREAVVEIRGAIRPGNVGYFPVKDCVEFKYYANDDANTVEDYPYALAKDAWSAIHTSRTRFKVVKEDGYGFYHNIINLSGEWVVLLLDKKIKQTRRLDLSALKSVRKEDEREALSGFLAMVSSEGDAVFRKGNDLIKRIVSMDPKESLPVLISFLNVPECGRHEQCSVFATILKASRKNPKASMAMLRIFERNDAVPQYYIRELIEKVSRYAP
jgi:hypothetical protein